LLLALAFLIILLNVILVSQGHNGFAITSITFTITAFAYYLGYQIVESKKQKKRLLEEREEEIKRVKERAIAEIQALKIVDFLKSSNIDQIKPTYSTRYIPKKTGGNRRIQIPNDELLEFQRNLDTQIRHRYSKFIHPYAHAFRPKRGIKSNAKPHAGNPVIIKLDIKNFFDNITTSHLSPWLEKMVGDDQYYQEKLLHLITSENALPQGAPTSPFLSNLIFCRIDEEIKRLAFKYKCKYTRYADDITISLRKDEQKVVGKIIYGVEAILNKHNFQLNKNPKKLHVLRGHQAQRICGVTVNQGETSVSRKQRRIIRAAKHHLQTGRDATYTEDQIKGWESHINHIMQPGLRPPIRRSKCPWCKFKYKPYKINDLLYCQECSYSTASTNRMVIHWNKNHGQLPFPLENCCGYHKIYLLMGASKKALEVLYPLKTD